MWQEDEGLKKRCFSFLSWLSHQGKSLYFFVLLWASWLNVFINEGHQFSLKIPKPGCAPQSFEKLFKNTDSSRPVVGKLSL